MSEKMESEDRRLQMLRKVKKGDEAKRGEEEEADETAAEEESDQFRLYEVVGSDDPLLQAVRDMFNEYRE